MSTSKNGESKIRTEKPGHGPRLEIDGKLSKSRTESERGIIGNVAANMVAYDVNPWK